MPYYYNTADSESLKVKFGFSCQVVVEKKIMRETKLTRHGVGRDKFVSEVWNWKNEYGGTILKQLRCLERCARVSPPAVDAHVQQLDQYLKKFDEELRRERESAATTGSAVQNLENNVKSTSGRGGRKN
ncbi:hypothetical protein LOK49_LG09G01073 [Camellia lanceoleosa]|uniref:Uncharacterized protein n=1 Tax=Camellia lanceoleosa TaxID=1840588 RepID=A0ACC0GLF6_9ERIC|nr:hypothetical protein LOK49_LG09G01073 [Camellia lanceoleosa]